MFGCAVVEWYVCVRLRVCRFGCLFVWPCVWLIVCLCVFVCLGVCVVVSWCVCSVVVFCLCAGVGA